MKRIGRFVWAFIASGLLFVALGSLVERPSETAAAAPLPPPASVLLCVEEALPVEPALPAQQADAGIHRALPEREQDDEACVTVSDGNGYPLRAETYFREVYAAFPPERMPG